MPRFHFSLETLLQHREDLEQKERDALFRLSYKYQTELRHHDDLVAKFRETMKDLSQKQNSSSDLQELNWYYLYLHRLTGEIGESETRLTEIGVEVENQKNAVIEATKKKKVLASLKVKRQKEFTAEMDKLEQKEVDDLVVARYAAREPAKGMIDNGKAGVIPKRHSTHRG